MPLHPPQETKFHVLLNSDENPDSFRLNLERIFAEVQMEEEEDYGVREWMEKCCKFDRPLPRTHKIYTLSLITQDTRGSIIDLLHESGVSALVNHSDDEKRMANRINSCERRTIEMYIELFRGFLEDSGTKIPPYIAIRPKRYKIQSNWFAGVQSWFNNMLRKNLIKDSNLKEKMEKWASVREVLREQSQIDEIDEILEELLSYLRGMV